MTMEQLKTRARGISLGLYAGDLGAVSDSVHMIEGWGAGIVHFDEMDGCFVPPFLGGAPLIGAARKAALDAICDAHLMIARPIDHVSAYVKAGADLITVHAEAEQPGEALARIRAEAAKAGRPVLAGLALMPRTDPDPALLEMADLILVLSLDPRDGMPPDITTACKRMMDLRQTTSATRPLMVFDGGVTLDTIPEIAAARPDMIVSGSAVMKSDDPARAFAQMRTAWQKAQN